MSRPKSAIQIYKTKQKLVLAARKMDVGSDISTVKPVYCRNRNPDLFAFNIDSTGMPVRDFKTKLINTGKRQGFDELEEYDKYKLVSEAFRYGDNRYYREIVDSLKTSFISAMANKLASIKLRNL